MEERRKMQHTKQSVWTVPKGIMHAPVTPLFEDGSIDYATFEKVINFHIEQGASALSVGFHIAESLNLTLQERKQLVEVAVKVAKGRVPILVNVSLPGTDQVVDLSKHAEKAGAQGVCVITPYYWHPPEESVFEHFAAVGSTIGISVVGYNSPIWQNGVSLNPNLLVRLIERLNNFVGVKDAGHNFEYFIEARRATKAVRPNFEMILGIEYLVPALAMGGIASMSTAGGVAPRLIRDLYDLCAVGKYEEARPLQDKFSHLWQLFKVEFPSRVKAAMEIMGRPVGKTRLPLRPLSEQEKRRLRDELQKLGILDQEPCGW